MFEATIEDIATMRSSLEPLNKIIYTVTIKVLSDKFHMLADSDAKHVGVEWILERLAFSEYRFDKEVEMTFDLPKLMEVLKRLEGKVKIKTDGNRAWFSDEFRIFNLGLIAEKEASLFEMVKIDWESKTDIVTKSLKQFVDDTLLFGDTVTFIADFGKFGVNSRNDESYGNSKAEIPKGDILLTNLTNKKVQSTFGTDYIKPFLDSGISNVITVNLSQDSPLKIEMKTDKVKLSAIICPRVAED